MGWWSKKFFCVFLLQIYLQINDAVDAAYTDGANNTTNIVCYYVSENGYKHAPPEILDPTLCTHIIYAFAGVSTNGYLRFRNKNLDLNNDMYSRVIALKKRNPNLKVILSVLDLATTYSFVATDIAKRKNFATSAKVFMERFGFDGLDVDWEKPLLVDRDNFVELMKALREELKDEFLISAAIYPRPSEGYNALELIKYADMINLMAYNYFGPWSKRTGQQSGLYSSSQDSAYEEKYLNTNASVNLWLNAGIPKDKLMMGIPFFGRSFTLKNPNWHYVHAPTIGMGKIPSPQYRNIEELFGNWTTVWDNEQKNYYRYHGDQWVGYEDVRSVREKVNYAISQELGGVMIWHLGADDVHGILGPKQGLLVTINEALGIITTPATTEQSSNMPTSSATPATSPATTQETTTDPFAPPFLVQHPDSSDEY